MRYHRPSVWVRIYLRPPQIGASDANQLLAFECSPISCRVTRADHRSADTWELVFDLEDFPFDPRLIRGATVEIFAADLALPSAQRDAMAFWAGLSPTQFRTHCLIAGVADQAENELDDDGRRLTLKGRDYTAFFLDARLNSDIRWGTKSFVRHIADLILERDTTAELAIEIAVEGDDGSTDRLILDPRSGRTLDAQAANAPATIQQVLKIRPMSYKARGDSTDPNQSKRMAREGETIWEALKEIALEAGFILYVELDRVVIRSPRTLNPEKMPPLGERFRFTIGHNVKRYAPRRDLGRQSNVNVRVTSFDPKRGVTLTAISPETPETDNPGAASSIGNEAGQGAKPVKQRVVVPFAVRGITNQAQLQKIADALREQLQQHDIEVEIETDTMVDTDGRPLWEIRQADPVIIDVSTTLASVLAKPVEQQIERLVSRGFEPGDAATILGQNDALGGFLAQLSLPLSAAEATFSYSSESSQGWSFSLRARGRRQATVTLESGVEAQVASG